MKHERKFQFNAQQAELISQSFNYFKNDSVKAIAARNTLGGKKIKFQCVYQRVAQPLL
jgi:hypothetical protein